MRSVDLNCPYGHPKFKPQGRVKLALPFFFVPNTLALGCKEISDG
jgi:hypothetical protein